jgi:hypothetical protein
MFVERHPCPLLPAVIFVFLQTLCQPTYAALFQPGGTVDDKPSAAEIKKLIEQLGSSQFAERVAASKRLQEIGKPALANLQKAAAETKDAELRRRAKDLIEKISPESSDTPWESLLKQGIREETADKDFQKAVETLTKAEKLARQKFHPNRQLAPPKDIPILTEIHLHLARCYRELNESQKAGNAYGVSEYYSNYDNEKRKEIVQEWSEMTDQLVSRWEKTIKDKIDKNAELEKLVAKYPLVVLHSRRFAPGTYLKSAYSFKYETTDEEKHGNDVQILFDNGNGEKTFEINMTTDQKSLVFDIRTADFTKEPDPNKLEIDAKQSWQKGNVKATEGHTYLEKVEDGRGNRFYVLFHVLAVDKDSNYIAFVWRRLPGGTIKKDR